jgi:hypothetical protein
VAVRQIGEFANGVRKTSKLGGTELIQLFRVGVFTLFNCELVTTQDISIEIVQQIGESTNGVREISKLGGTALISLFPGGMFSKISNIGGVCSLCMKADPIFELG